MLNRKIIIGNWKMNPVSLEEAESLFVDILKSVSTIRKTEIVVCAPFLYLESLKKLSLKYSRRSETKKISLGAQNIFWKKNGAYTGEVSVDMLRDLGVKYVIVGHSERRAMGENNSDINKKIKISLKTGLFPVLCVGERERNDNHEYFNFIKTQLAGCLEGISKNFISKIIIAYEPIWAISSTVGRKNATPTDSREMVIYIRKILYDKFGKDSVRMKIIYGGSVNEKDAIDFLQNGGVDGLLPGRASLNSKKFSKIIEICEALSK